MATATTPDQHTLGLDPLLSVPSEITARTWPSGADPRESVVLVVVAADRR